MRLDGRAGEVVLSALGRADGERISGVLRLAGDDAVIVAPRLSDTARHAPSRTSSCSPSCSFPPRRRAQQNPWLERRVLNIAHQGGEDEFPSNTLYAFKRATKAGADMLELDVGVTKDGKVVVSHDTTLDRTTNGKGTIASRTLRQIRKLDGAYWFARGDDAYATTAAARPTSCAGSRRAGASRRRATRAPTSACRRSRRC